MYLDKNLATSLDALKKYIDKLYPLPQKEWNELSNLFLENTLKKGDYFARDGVIENQLAFILEGVFRGFYRNKEGYEYNKRFFLSGHLIGAYASMVSQTPSKINLQALTDCRFLVVDFPSVVQLFDNYPMIERVFRILPERLYLVKEKRELELVMLNAKKRYQIFQEEYPTLENIVPQYHIASYLGITPTQLSRIRSKMGE